MNDMIPTLVECLITEHPPPKKKAGVHNHNLFFLWSYLFFFSNADAMRSRAPAFLSSISSLLSSMLALNLFIWISSSISEPCWYKSSLPVRKNNNLGCKIFSCRKKNVKICPTFLSSSSPFHRCLSILFLFMNIFWYTSVGVLIRKFNFSDFKI